MHRLVHRPDTTDLLAALVKSSWSYWREYGPFVPRWWGKTLESLWWNEICLGKETKEDLKKKEFLEEKTGESLSHVWNLERGKQVRASEPTWTWIYFGIATKTYYVMNTPENYYQQQDTMQEWIVCSDSSQPLLTIW